ncbi:tyrosine-protein phosphatase [Jiella avicenniae]|uniref:Tyrosine-protein phosphatase n=1 Tax=Jiella avicenniae TaxID=2907202 RepID=A0A9X1P5W1_9HYPH|nr:tyrosine-protein phosphatase [Jiella avicenniae]MCE7030344.1 tyrosine-protein phosphatase [Jiella avicenniae]
MLRLPKILRRALLALAVVAAPPLGYAGYLRSTGNVHTVEPDRVYRSGQLGPAALQRLIDDRHIRSIINLRGVNPDQQWYRDELLVADENGVKEISIGISARKEPSLATLRRIEAAMRTAPKPLLIHCMGGADRSGLASAIYDYAIGGRTAEVARGQLSFAYGHFPWLLGETAAMDRAFDDFVQQMDASKDPAAGETSE